MAFELYAKGYTKIEAQRLWDEARTYLSNSDLADALLEGIEGHEKVVSVVIGNALENTYRWPDWLHKKGIVCKSPEGKKSAGIVAWCPGLTVEILTREQRRFLFVRYTRQRVDRISPMLALLHELGHAWQYLSENEEYVKMKTGVIQRDLTVLEHQNVAAIENTVANELLASGRHEGIRLRYTDLARLTPQQQRQAERSSSERAKALESFRYMFITNSSYTAAQAPGGTLGIIKL